MHLRSRGIGDAFASFCRRYGMVDEKGTIRGAESVRLLMFTVLFRRNPNPVATAVDAAVRANKPMMLGAMFKRLQVMFRTAEHRGKRAVRSDEDRGYVRVVLDDWLYQSLQGFEVHYRQENGVVDDIGMIADILRDGLSDRNLSAIAEAYVRRVEPMRRAVREIEAYTTPILQRVVGQERPVERLARAG